MPVKRPVAIALSVIWGMGGLTAASANDASLSEAVSVSATPALVVTRPAVSPLVNGTPMKKPEVPPISNLISDEDFQNIEKAYNAFGARQWSQVRRYQKLIEDDVARDLIEWSLLTRGGTGASFEEVLDFAERRGDWPRFIRVLQLAERAIPKNMAPDQVIAWFAGQEPLTGEGKIRLGEAYLALGQLEYGKVWIERAWIEDVFSTSTEREILNDHKNEISTEAHDQRLQNLMWQRKFTQARRVMPYASQDARAVADTRMRMASNPGNISGAIRKLPSRLRDDAGVLFDEVRLTRRVGSDNQARALLLDAPVTAEAMVDPERWWVERHLQARKAHNEGENEEAYRIASNHGLTSGAKFAEAEFLSGWLALRFLDKPETALKHFDTLETGVSFPISVARARYWQGRALEAMGRTEEARERYLGAGEHPYTFYGQLALENPIVDAPALILPEQRPAGETMRKAFDRQDFVRAIRLLDTFDRGRDLRIFFYHYADSLETQDDLTLLAGLATELDYVHYGIRVSKKAIQQNIALVDFSYPVRELPKYQGKGEAPDPALVFGLSRQESEFNPRAVSSAGARGLMQLMPGTARITAAKHGLPYNTAWLLDDPSYNTQLGMAHLSDVIKRFDGSYIMTIAAYNAGAHRVDRWVRDYGDPRTGDIDPIDWVESIPFKETRNYVQRVLENTQVYRNRLSGRSEPIQIVEDLTRSNNKTGKSRLLTAKASLAPANWE